MKVVASKQFSLQSRDFWRGLVTAIIIAVFTAIYQVIEKGSFDFNWKEIGIAALIAGFGYLFKNGVLEPPKVIVTTNSNTQAVNKAAKADNLL